MEKIILDVDTGQDDAVAIAMAAGLRDRLEIAGIIATMGNTTLENALENTLNIAEAAGLRCPVFKGSVKPLLRERAHSEDFHGPNGLTGPVFGKREYQEAKGNGILWAIEEVRKHPGEVTFVSVGPYTDLAVMIKADPAFAPSLKRIVVMGGSLGPGNATPSAEFNIFADPEAAEIVFNSGTEVVMLGLDVTNKVRLTKERAEELRKAPESRYKGIFFSQMEYYAEAYRKFDNDVPAMHDPCTIAYLADNACFSLEPYTIHVETKGDITVGRTVGTKGGKVKVALGVDIERFWGLMSEAFRALP